MCVCEVSCWVNWHWRSVSLPASEVFWGYFWAWRVWVPPAFSAMTFGTDALLGFHWLSRFQLAIENRQHWPTLTNIDQHFDQHFDQHWPTLTNNDLHCPTLTNIDQHCRHTEKNHVLEASDLKCEKGCFFQDFVWIHELWELRPECQWNLKEYTNIRVLRNSWTIIVSLIWDADLQPA